MGLDSYFNLKGYIKFVNGTWVLAKLLNFVVLVSQRHQNSRGKSLQAKGFLDGYRKNQ